MLAESLLISLAGGALGVAIAVAGVQVLTSLLPADFPRAGSIHVRTGMFLLTLFIAGSGVLFGLAPALQASRADLQRALREGGRGVTAGGGVWVRNALMVGEISLACVLLIGAGLMLRSFVNMLHADPGFRPQHVLTASVTVPGARYPKPTDVVKFFDRLTASLQALPGIQKAGVSTDLPWSGWDDNFSGFLIEGQDSSTNDQHHARFHTVSGNYFQALGMPLIRGRFFNEHDNRDSLPVIIINRTMARMYWGSDKARSSGSLHSERLLP